MSSDKQAVQRGAIVWVGKPWILPAAIIRTAAVIIIAFLFVWIELVFGLAFLFLAGLAFFIWTMFAFIVIWAFSILDLFVYRASFTYTLRQDGLEIRRGIIRLHAFVVTPAGFGDLLVYQSLGGRIFGYGDITVNSQGERQTKLVLVHSPFLVADRIRDILGKPIVRVANNK